MDAVAPPADALSFGGRHYKIYGDAIPWHAAEERCRELGGRLAILSDAGPREFLLDKVGESGAWVGSLRVDGEYRWIDGTVADEGWAYKEPNNYGGRENAAQLRPPGLNDGDSESRHEWICEW